MTAHEFLRLGAARAGGGVPAGAVGRVVPEASGDWAESKADAPSVGIPPAGAGGTPAVVEKRTVGLPVEQASYIDPQVAKGAYASASKVVRAGLRALQERDAAAERWLREEVAQTYDAMQVEPSRTIPSARVSQKLRAHHAKRLKARRRA